MEDCHRMIFFDRLATVAIAPKKLSEPESSPIPPPTLFLSTKELNVNDSVQLQKKEKDPASEKRKATRVFTRVFIATSIVCIYIIIIIVASSIPSIRQDFINFDSHIFHVQLSTPTSSQPLVSTITIVPTASLRPSAIFTPTSKKTIAPQTSMGTSTSTPTPENSITGVVHNVYSPYVLGCNKEPIWGGQLVTTFSKNSSIIIVGRLSDSSWLLTNKGCWVSSKYIVIVSGNLSDLTVNYSFPASTATP